MTATEAIEPMLVHVDPRRLLVDLNVRRAANLDKAFLDSIRDHGVLVPVVAVDSGDALRVRYGQRRVLAAAKVGLETVPVVVIGDEDDDEAARIITQWHENEHRANLSTADRVAAVEQLALLGYTADDIVQRTRSSKADVDQALAAAGSKLAKKSAQRYEFLDLAQAAALAEFDDDKDTAERLIETAKKNPGMFAHQLQRARDESATKAAIANLRERLERQGVTILGKQPDTYARSATAQRIDYLVDGDKKPLNSRTHKKCPGHAAFIAMHWGAKGEVPEAVYYCTDWRANGHKARYGSSHGSASSSAAGEKSAEQAKKERSEVIANNKAWRSAETVRRQWLKDFLARQAPPPGAAVYVAAELAQGVSGDYAMPRELLGVDDLDATIGKATDGRAQVISLAIVLGSIEASTGTHSWRTNDWRGRSPAVQRYFTFLIQQGYTPSDVELIAAGAKRHR